MEGFVSGKGKRKIAAGDCPASGPGLITKDGGAQTIAAGPPHPRAGSWAMMAKLGR